jgi:hypothetical protein
MRCNIPLQISLIRAMKQGCGGSIKEGWMDKECQRLAVDLSAYADGELDAGAASAVEAHLEHCAKCRREHARTAKLISLVKAGARVGGSDKGVLGKLVARANEVTSGLHGRPGAAAKGRRVERD